MLTRHATFDRFALALGLIVYLSYAVMDLIILERAQEAIMIRLAGTALCGGALALIHFGRIPARLDRLIPLMVVFLGSLLNVIIFIEPSIANNYFIGLIQIAVFISFMLRAGFVSSNVGFFALLAGYLAAVANKDLIGTVQLTTQMYFLVMMFLSCSCGIYILERYRRTLFLNSRIIDEQNAQLARMIEDLEQTVSRKTALLKVFTHLMKTPVHQIVGFLQVVRNEIETAADGAHEASDSIRYAEAAASELRRNVEEMVDYHLADNAVRSRQTERIDVREVLEEYFYDSIESGALELSGGREHIDVDQQLFLLAAKHLRIFFKDRTPELTSIEVRRTPSGEVEIDFVDAGPPMNAQEFHAHTCHLTSIENYLSGEGANPEMTLRTASRALEQDGAEMSPLRDGRSGLRVRFPKKLEAAA